MKLVLETTCHKAQIRLGWTKVVLVVNTAHAHKLWFTCLKTAEYSIVLKSSLICQWVCTNDSYSTAKENLTLHVRGPSYLSLTRSISWLLIPWLLTSPEHQQQCYWLYRLCRYFSYSRNDFEYMCQINVEEWHKMQLYVYVPSEKFSA